MTSVSVILASLVLAKPAASPDPKPVPIAGMVVDATGRPAAGRRRLAGRRRPTRRGTSGRARDRGRHPGRVVRRCTRRPSSTLQSGADGRFTLDVPAEAVARPDELDTGDLGRGAADRRPASPAIVCPGSCWPMTRPCGSSSAPGTRELTRPRARSEAGRPVPASSRPGPAGSSSPSRSARRSRPRRMPSRPRRHRGAGDASRSTRCASRRRGMGFSSRIATDPGDSGSIGDHRPRPGRADPGAIDRARQRADPRRDAPRPIAGRRLCRLGAGGLARARATSRGGLRSRPSPRGWWTLCSTSTRAQAHPCDLRRRARLLVRAGRTTEVAIPMHPTVKVRGVVRERGNERPIAGVVYRPGHGHLRRRPIRRRPTRRPVGIPGLPPRARASVAMPSPIRLPMPFSRAGRPADAAPGSPAPRRQRADHAIRSSCVAGRRGERNRREQGGKPVAGAEVEAIRTGRRAGPVGAGAHRPPRAASSSTASIPGPS